MNLRGALPPEVQRALVERTLSPGTIIHVYCPFISKPNNKFLLIACIDPDPVVFVINSKPHPFILRSFMDLQIRLDPTESDFLTHESFIDCSNPNDTMAMRDYVDLIINDPTAGRRMEINERTRTEVIKAIKRNRIMTPAMKRRLLSGLIS
jgi:hypothetical protein